MVPPRRRDAWWSRGIALPLALGGAALTFQAIVLASPYSQRVLTLAGIEALLVLGYQFIFGRLGALSLAQGSFFGLGAYTTGILGSRLGWGFLLTFPLSLLVPAALALIVAAPTLRLASHYFALATLGIGQVVLILVVNGGDLTGGAVGLPGVPGIILAGWSLPRGLPLLLFVWGWVGLGALLAWRLTRGLYGTAFTVLRDNDLAAAAIGLDGGALRLAAFLLSALYGGAAGALYAHSLRVVSTEALEFPVMVTCLAAVVVGGRGRIAGAILGALLLVHLPEWFRFLDSYRLIAYGAALLAMIIAAPDGIIGALERLRARLLPEAPEPPPPAHRPAATQAPSRAPLLEVRGLEKHFGGVRAVDGASFEAARGEILGLIGPNGSGKTTLVNLITGIVPADRGTIRFAGEKLTGLAAHRIARRGIARSFQTPALVEPLSALDAVAVARAAATGRIGFVPALAGRDAGAAGCALRGEARYLLERLGAGAAALLPCGSLSQALGRRVEIARALALDPALILLDEPAAGLAEADQADLARRLEALAATGITLIIIEHNLPFLMALAGRVICLDRGRIVAQGTPAQIRSDPAVRDAYLGPGGPLPAEAERQ